MLRVRGQGVPGPGGGRGDLLVTVEVAVPKHVGADERTAVEALAAAMQGNPGPIWWCERWNEGDTAP